MAAPRNEEGEAAARSKSRGGHPIKVIRNLIECT